MNVYVLRADGTNLFKVGHTNRNVEARASDLQTGCPYLLLIHKVLSGDTELEQDIRRELRGFESDGGNEWYDVDVDTIDSIIEEMSGQKFAGNNDEKIRHFIRNFTHPNLHSDEAVVRDMAKTHASFIHAADVVYGKNISNETFSGPGYVEVDLGIEVAVDSPFGKAIDSVREKHGLGDSEAVSYLFSHIMMNMFFERYSYLDDILRERRRIRRKHKVKK